MRDEKRIAGGLSYAGACARVGVGTGAQRNGKRRPEADGSGREWSIAGREARETRESRIGKGRNAREMRLTRINRASKKPREIFCLTRILKRKGLWQLSKKCVAVFA